MDFLTVMLWIIVIVAGLLVFAVAWWGAQMSEGETLDTARKPIKDKPQVTKRTAWVIYNPVKVEDEASFKQECVRFASQAGFEACTFTITTENDPGLGQAQVAKNQQADRVIVAGGDGTVRLVAGILSGTGIPLGILPLGTGNLYARNLDIPTDDLEKAMRIAFMGSSEAMDLGWIALNCTGESSQLSEEDNESTPEARHLDIDGYHPFLVMAGLGFDADMMADTNSELKKHIGWGAYVAAGIKNAFGDRLHVNVQLDNSDHFSRIHLRTLLVANCGKLPGGVMLVPDAKPNDGVLDVCALDIRNGILGWANMAGRILMQGLGRIRRDYSIDSSSISFRQAESVEIRTRKPRQVQIDGDPAGLANHLSVQIDKLGLQIVTPNK